MIPGRAGTGSAPIVAEPSRPVAETPGPTARKEEVLPTWSKWSNANTDRGEWWCVPEMTRAQRKRRGLRRQPKPMKSSYEACYPFGVPGREGSDHSSIHLRCGYRNALGQVIPWSEDPRNARP